jgi:hypothetical protein
MALYFSCPTLADFEVLANGSLRCTTSDSNFTSEWVQDMSPHTPLSESDYYTISAWMVAVLLGAYGIKMIIKLLNEDASR